jgi:hypothetical protein
VRRAARLLCALASSAALAGCGASDPTGAPVPRLHGPPLATETRPDTTGRGSMFSFGADDVVETFGSKGGHFLLHFTRQGPNAVPPADADASGVPDFVEQAAETYDEVVAKYDGLGFLAPLSDEGLPDNGGDGRFDVYFVDFAGQGDGHYADDACGPKNMDQCAGYMVQENDFAGYGYPSTTIANRILASHEFFHAVQAAYDTKQGPVLAEGTAVWATETFDDTLGDFEGFLPGYFQNPDRPLNLPMNGATDPFSYGTAIFWEFLGERYEKPLVRTLWEQVVNGTNGVADPGWWDVIDPMLKAEAKASFADAFVDFATWNLFTGVRADPKRAYAKGAGFSAVTLKPADLPYSADELRVFYASAQYFQSIPDKRTAMTAALVSPAGGAGDETEGLHLLMVANHANQYGEVKRLADPKAGVETIDTTGAGDVIVFVVNGKMDGASRKPGLCIGTTDEVAACRAALGAGGAGGGGAGGAGGAWPGSGGSHVGAGGGSTTTTTTAAPSAATPAEPAKSGCGCRAAGGEGGDRGIGLLALAGLAIASRRRSSSSRI